MISQVLRQLDSLQTELSTIDPDRDCAAADKVAELAASLRRALSDVMSNSADRAGPVAAQDSATQSAAA